MAQGGFRQDQVAQQLHGGDFVDFAFLHVSSHVHRAFVRRDRDLGGVDAEIGIAAIHVVGLQLFHVAGKLFARVLVVLRIPRRPVGGARFEIVADFLVGEGVVAEDVDFLDLRHLAFADLDFHRHPVAIELGDVRQHRDVVLAPVVVLVDQFLPDPVQRQAIEGLAFGQADFLQALLQVVGLDVLVAAQGELADRRPLDHLDHQDVAFAAEFHVGEELGVVQRADGPLGLRIGHPVALVHRQVVVDRAGRDAAEPVDADVRHHEGGERKRVGGEGGKQEQGGDTLHRRFRWVIWMRQPARPPRSTVKLRTNPASRKY